MAAIQLADAVGGNLLLGFISAVAFATILAVVAGLTLAGASAFSHDLYASVFRHGRVDQRTEMRVSRIATIVLGVLAIVLGIVFEKQNVAFMVGLAFAIAASSNFPVLFLSMFWRGLTTRGAVVGGWLGLIVAAVLTVLSKASGSWSLATGRRSSRTTRRPCSRCRSPSSRAGWCRGWTRARVPRRNRRASRSSMCAP